MPPTMPISSVVARLALDEAVEGNRRKLSTIPEGFKAHKTIQRFMENRAQMIETAKVWTGRWLKHLPLARSWLTVTRFVCRSGLRTRHLLAAPFGSYDQESEERYIPLANLAPTQARYEVINSMLSEEAVLGFEYGYSLARPNALTLWKPCSVTSPTVRRSSSTSSSRLVSASGFACPVSSASAAWL